MYLNNPRITPLIATFLCHSFMMTTSMMLTPIRTKAKAGRLVLVHRSHLRLLLYYEAAVRLASRALTV